MKNDLTTYQIYLILLGYLTEQNDNAQMLRDLLVELYRRTDKAESVANRNEMCFMQKSIANGIPLDDIKAELKARLWRWRGKTNLNIDKVAMETIINEVFDEE